VRVVEVAPRDGLQNEPDLLPIEVRAEYIHQLLAAGVRAIEVGAFVRPDRVPQMADTDALLAMISAPPAAELWALVPNMKGLERARACGVTHVALLTAASESFCRANLGADSKVTMDRLAAVARAAKAEGISVRGYISTCFWCPFEGRVDAEHARRLALELLEDGCDEVAVADTVGAATPRDVDVLLSSLLRDVQVNQLGVHFHDTRGTALANVLRAVQLGVTTVDASAGGLGGCPFAPGAQGNLATEDLLYMLHGMDLSTGVDLEGVRQASLALEQRLGRQLPSRYLRAGRLVVGASASKTGDAR